MKRSYSDNESELNNIVELFKKLPIDDSENNSNNIDLLVSEINKIEISDPDYEFRKLVKNFYKLKEFKEIKNNSTSFQKSFKLFMEKIDSINQYYLKNIDFSINTNNTNNYYDNLSIKDTVKQIEELLDKSLSVNDCNIKLDLVLEAYSNLILFIENEFEIKQHEYSLSGQEHEYSLSGQEHEYKKSKVFH
jgi:hypothetical protein